MKRKLFNLARTSIFHAIIFLLVSCNGGFTQSNNNFSNIEDSLVVEKTGMIPVLDGKAITTGIYVRNNSNQRMENISYTILNPSQGSKITLVNNKSCKDIPAKSSCLLPIITPELKIGVNDSNIIIAEHSGKLSEQMINYHYVDSNNYTGVNFGENSQLLFGSNDYATVYVYSGKNQPQSSISFNVNNVSLEIVSGLTNGTLDIPVDAVIPLELKSGQNITTNQIKITPSYQKDSNTQTTKAIESNGQLLVTITPTQQANLLMSRMPILSQDESSAILTIMNNGTRQATTINLNAGTGLSISNSSVAPCTATLSAGASCNYRVNLTDTYNTGSATLTLNYNNTQQTIVSTQTVYYLNSNVAPMVTVIPDQSVIIEQINQSQSIIYTITNLGEGPLNNVLVRTKSTLKNASLAIQSNNCTTKISAGANCQIKLNVNASSQIESGIVYLEVGGDFSAKIYNFVSLPTSVTIDASDLKLISVNPGNDTIVPVSQNFISMVFNNPVDINSLNANTISVVKFGSTINLLGSCSLISPSQANCSLTNAFENNTDYKLNITTQVKATSGVYLETSWVSNFKTIYINPQQRLSSGSTYGCMLDIYGAAYCWGYNEAGSLGVGNYNQIYNTPQKVLQGDIPSNIPLVAISAGTSVSAKGTTCAISANAKAYCWGDNQYYAVGSGSTVITKYNLPTIVVTNLENLKSEIPANTKIVAIDNTNTMGCVLDESGQAYCWGNTAVNGTAYRGYLGNLAGTQTSAVPIKVYQSASGMFKQLSVGAEYACGLNKLGEIWCWGNNVSGQLGNGNTSSQKTPIRISSGEIPPGVMMNFVSVSKDNSADSNGNNQLATCAIASNGKAYCWGANSSGQLGIGSSTASNTPKQVFTQANSASSNIPSNEVLTSISAGSRSVCAISSSGIAYCWGLNNYGQLGVGNVQNSNVAKRITAISGFNSIVTAFDNGTTVTSASSPALSCGLLQIGAFYCWGDNRIGQLGVGITGGYYTTPQLLNIP